MTISLPPPGIAINDWIYAQLIITIQGALIALLLTAPLTASIKFFTNLLISLAGVIGFQQISLTSSSSADSGDDSNINTAIMRLLLSGAYHTSARIVQNKIVPNNWIVSVYGCGDIQTDITGQIKFDGFIFPWTTREINRIQRSLVSTQDGIKTSCIRYLKVHNGSRSEITPMIHTLPLPMHITNNQSRIVQDIVDDFQVLGSRQSLRGAKYMNILLTGPPGGGKTTIAHQLVRHLSGFLICVSELDQHTLPNLRETVCMVRQFAGNSSKTMFYKFDLKRGNDLAAFTMPIVILVDEWDAVLAQYRPVDAGMQAAIAKVLADTTIEEAEANVLVRKIKQRSANNSVGDLDNKHIVNEFLDYLTTLDNTITVFISNSDMSHVNQSFVRDGRITHRIEMPSLTREDVLNFAEKAVSLWTPAGETSSWSGIREELNTVLTAGCIIPSLATVSQILDLARTPTEAVAGITRALHSVCDYVESEEEDDDSRTTTTQ